MIQIPQVHDPDASIIVVNVGNTSTTLARWRRRNVTDHVHASSHDAAQIDESIARLWEVFTDEAPVASVIASVQPEALEVVRKRLDARLQREPLVVGEKIGRPIDLEVEDPTSVGMDRICAAAAAYDRLRRSCAIVDFGTAVTVDLVNDEGTFMGGAILPGVRMQLASLHEHTALLPQVEPAFPKNVIGRNTAEAIQNGVCRGLAGSVRWLIEAYATSIHHWPQVVATGGDALFMAEHCDFLDSLALDLGLMGVGLAYAKYLEEMGAV